jgi:hypothetical protein
MIKAFTVSIVSLFFFICADRIYYCEYRRILRKSGTFEINLGRLYKKGDCPGKHGTKLNPVVSQRQILAVKMVK